MHNAPPVVYPVGRCAWGLRIMAGLAALGALGLGIWQQQASLSWAHAAWAWGVWCLCVVMAFAWRSGQTMGSGRLLWTGEAWFWQSDPNDTPGPALGHTRESLPVRAVVLLDTGAVMLLSLQPLDASGRRAGRLRHAWLQEAMMPSLWHGFRCAVYSRPMAVRDAAASSDARS